MRPAQSRHPRAGYLIVLFSLMASNVPMVGAAESGVNATRPEFPQADRFCTVSGQSYVSGLSEVRVHRGTQSVRVLSNLDFSKLGGWIELPPGAGGWQALQFVTPAVVLDPPDSLSGQPDLVARWQARWAHPDWPAEAVTALGLAPFRYVVLEPTDAPHSADLSDFLEALHQHCAANWPALESAHDARLEQARLHKIEADRVESDRAARRAAGIPAIRLLRIEKGAALQERLRRIEADRSAAQAPPTPVAASSEEEAP